ncbi:MAG: META domain-containing protein [Candidatus Hydrogenedentes bacterium]|nr:META domain-containing protein [Candidatus Hydrogenedentota bacterium]
MRRRPTAVLTLLLATIAGCAATPAGPDHGPGAGAATAKDASDPMSIQDIAWELAGIGEASAPEAPVPDTSVTLLLDAASGEASGSAGCNRYVGKYTLDGNGLTFGPIAATKRYCGAPEGVMAQESAVLAALQATSHFTLEDDVLTLHQDGDRVLRFARSGAKGGPDASPLAALNDHVGAYPREINLWEHPAVSKRLQALLGGALPAFLENMGVQGPLSAEDGLLYVTGNKPHEGGIETAAFVADPARDQIQVWLITGGEARLYAEKDPPLPDPADVQTWKANLDARP